MDEYGSKVLLLVCDAPGCMFRSFVTCWLACPAMLVSQHGVPGTKYAVVVMFDRHYQLLVLQS